MEDIYKEVYFDQFCKKCEHKDKKESEDPCFECLDNPENLYSHKPVNYKPKNQPGSEKTEKQKGLM